MPKGRATVQPDFRVSLPPLGWGAALVLGVVTASLGVYAVWGGAWLSAVLPLMLVVLLVTLAGALWVIFERQSTHARTTKRVRDLEWRISVLLHTQDLRIEQNAAQHALALKSEIEMLQARQKVLESQAYHDGLTGLANRVLLADRHNLAVERAKRNGVPFAVLMVDLNEFKTINDRHGHATGDAVLVAMANRLLGAVRGSDTVARVGGDEFVLLIESVGRREEFAQLGQKLIDSLFEPIMLPDGTTVHSGASLGMAMYPSDGESLAELMSVADKSMYECKASGLMNLP